MAEITKDTKGIFPQIKSLMEKDFPFCKWFAYGSRTHNSKCNKCDFDIMLYLPPDKATEFLQEVGVFGSSVWRRKINQHTKGRPMIPQDYIRTALRVFSMEKEREATAYFAFMKNEYDEKIRIDIHFTLKYPNPTKFVPL